MRFLIPAKFFRINMKKYFLLTAVLALLFVSKGSFAQYSNNSNSGNNGNTRTSSPSDNQDNSFLSHFYAGGGFVLEFGNIGSAVGASPLIGYKFTDRLSAGVGANYIYLTGLDYYGNSYQTSVYGGDVFGRYRITPKIFAYAEYGFTNYETPAI